MSCPSSIVRRAQRGSSFGVVVALGAMVLDSATGACSFPVDDFTTEEASSGESSDDASGPLGAPASASSEDAAPSFSEDATPPPSNDRPSDGDPNDGSDHGRDHGKKKGGES